MPAVGFPAFLEVAAHSFGLTVSCIVGSRYALRCVRSTTPVNLTGLAASLLTVFFCLYGLTYWFNGIAGYDCTALAAVTGTSLSASNALTFVNLFIVSNSLHQASTRWERFRWLGLLLTAFNWGTLVMEETMVTAEVNPAGLDGPRCIPHFNATAFRVKWIAQLLNQLFQAAAFLLPLHRKLKGAAKVRFLSGSPNKATTRYRRTFRFPVWRSIIAETVAVVVTVVVVALAFEKARGQLKGMPMVAVEILDNAANLGAIFYAIHAHVPNNNLPKDGLPLKIPKRLDLVAASKKYRSLSALTGGSSSRGKRVGMRRAGGGIESGSGSGSEIESGIKTGAESGIETRDGSGIEGRFGSESDSKIGSETESDPSGPLEAGEAVDDNLSQWQRQRRFSGPIKRLPRVLDMSPEVRSRSSDDSPAVLLSRSPPLGAGTAAAAAAAAAAAGWKSLAGNGENTSDEGKMVDRREAKSGSSGRHTGPVGPLFFTSHTTRSKWVPPGSNPATEGTRTVDVRVAASRAKMAVEGANAGKGDAARPSEPKDCAALSRALHFSPSPRSIARLCPRQPTTTTREAPEASSLTGDRVARIPAFRPRRASNQVGGQGATGIPPRNPGTEASTAADVAEGENDHEDDEDEDDEDDDEDDGNNRNSHNHPAGTVMWPLPLGPRPAGFERLSSRAASASALSPVARRGGRKRLDSVAEADDESEQQGTGDDAGTESGAATDTVGPKRSTLDEGRVGGAGVRLALTPAARVSLSGPSSPSIGCRSGRPASAFSAGSWRTSSYNGDGRHNAPAVTVRSPASYFVANLNG